VPGVRRFGTGRLVALALALAALPSVEVSGQTEAEGLSASFRKASRRVLPAVVTVRPVGTPNPFDAPPVSNNPFAPEPSRPVPREPSGSGVVIDAARGLVLTNNHVVQDAAQVVVVLGNGRERPARQVLRDPKSDLALVAIDPVGLVQASDSLLASRAP
jgi:S1-C subfamily serine protease